MTNPKDIEKKFRKLVYEPVHESTTCWCEPIFRKEDDGKLHIVHNEQRDILTAFLLQEIERAYADERAWFKDIVSTLRVEKPHREDEEMAYEFKRNIVAEVRARLLDAINMRHPEAAKGDLVDKGAR